MSETNKPGFAFWIIGIIALFWNGMGVNTYLQSAFNTEAATAGLNENQITLLDSMPAWYTALFAIAVFSGLIGAITLLMRKQWATILFIVSFIAATINQVYWLFGTDAIEVFSEFQPYLMPLLIVGIGLFLIWYSKDQKKRAVLS